MSFKSLKQLRVFSSQPNVGAVPRHVIDDACLEAYQRELDYLMRTLRRLGVDLDDVEDLAQDVFLALRHAWPQYDPTRALKPFLFGIAFRVAASHRRKHWREVPFATVDAPDRGPSPDRTFEANQARAQVLDALDRIPLKRRAVLVMHDLDEIPVQDVAATLDIPLFTAYSRLRKARRELEAAVTRAQGRSTGR